MPNMKQTLEITVNRSVVSFKTFCILQNKLTYIAILDTLIDSTFALTTVVVVSD